jgi:anaerobic magnesium-protoporphyrin IX monomethyl ester cyclase
MKVALVAPPFHGRVRGLPLGLAYLAAVLANAGFEVRAIDMTINGVGDDELVELLHSFQPEVIGISVVCSTYLEGIRVARVCKATLGGSVSVVMGGPHVAHSAEIILARHADVDICVIGEAEETICDLTEALSHDPAKIASVRGIAFRDVFGIRLTPSRALMENLDLLPLPSRHLFSMAACPHFIEAFGIGSPNRVEMIASRGCPYPCEFCSTKEFWQRRYRKRSPENVLMELEHLSQGGLPTSASLTTSLRSSATGFFNCAV